MHKKNALSGLVLPAFRQGRFIANRIYQRVQDKAQSANHADSIVKRCITVSNALVSALQASRKAIIHGGASCARENSLSRKMCFATQHIPTRSSHQTWLAGILVITFALISCDVYYDLEGFGFSDLDMIHRKI